MLLVEEIGVPGENHRPATDTDNLYHITLYSVIFACAGFELTTFVVICIQGRIQDLKLGGAHLKKLRRAEGGAKIFGVFLVKNHDFTPKNQIFSNFRGGRAPGAPPAGSAPGIDFIGSYKSNYPTITTTTTPPKVLRSPPMPLLTIM